MPIIRIDDEVYTWLQERARPFEDSPNSVLRRISKLDDGAELKPVGKRRVDVERQLTRGEKTTKHVFRKNILEILRKHGGKARRTTVLEELGKAMDNQLTEFDKLNIPSGPIRWRKSAEWEINAMRKQGILKPVSDTPRGVWAIK